jgi:hypothetical protein
MEVTQLVASSKAMQAERLASNLEAIAVRVRTMLVSGLFEGN